MPLVTPAQALAEAEQQGVDLSLLRERLRMTPTERLQRHQAALALVDALTAAGQRKRERVRRGDAADRAV